MQASKALENLPGRPLIIWSGWFILALLSVSHLWLALTNPLFMTSSTVFEEVSKMLIILSFASIGSLVRHRRPENAIGSIYMVVALLAVIDWLLLDIARFTLPGNEVEHSIGLAAAWITSWFGIILFAFILIFPLLYFPNGQLLSPRWQILVNILILFTTIQIIAVMLLSGPLPDFPNLENPFAVQALQPICVWINQVSYLLGDAAICASALSLVLRYRSARDVERQQLRWMAYAAAVPLLLVSAAAIFLSSDPNAPSSQFEAVVLVFALIMVPISAGIAILRYRLYFIDIIIRRTLVYSILTIVLAMIYYAGVVILGLATANQGQPSPAVIVLITLLIAALFNPLRRRIQDFIDRRFFRQKYDAEQALAAFAAVARSETDLAQLSNRLMITVSETLQPQQLNLWLKAETGRISHGS